MLVKDMRDDEMALHLNKEDQDKPQLSQNQLLDEVPKFPLYFGYWIVVL